MAGLQDPIRTLRRLFEEEAETRKRRERAALEVNPAEYDENLERYDRQITEAYNAIEECLRKRVLRFGMHHDRHAAIRQRSPMELRRGKLAPLRGDPAWRAPAADRSGAQGLHRQ